MLTFAVNKHESMTKEELRIVYMGTPDFAVESLKRLVEGGYNIVGVVTMPDKPMGRHQEQLSQSAVKQYAVSQGLRVLQPVKLKDETFLEELRSLKADLQIVVAFRMLPDVVWEMPPLGTFNLHASLLPQYRGAAPINWAIINGERETGITTFFLQHEIDTGNIIQQVKIPIGADDNVGIIHDKLMLLGGDLVLETVDNIIKGEISQTPQTALAEGVELKPAPKIFKETCQIDWCMAMKDVHNFVRGLSPYPAAWTTMRHDGKMLNMKIYKTSCTERNSSSHKVGEAFSEEDRLYVAVSDGVLEILELQLAGKKRMSAADFLRGFRMDGTEMFCRGIVDNCVK